jgi:ACS family hexuronate transporter-like MFS transporter
LMVTAIPAVFASTIAGFITLVSIATLGHGGWATNIMTLPGDMLPHQDVGALYGFTAFGGGMGSIIFMQIIGKLVDLQKSFNTVFIIAGILPLIAAAIVVIVTGKIHMMQLTSVGERARESATAN